MKELTLNELYPGMRYNIDDPDGAMYMLDHDFAGCMVFLFSDRVDDSTNGTVTIDGKVCDGFILKQYDGGLSLLGIPLKGCFRDYDTPVKIVVQGFKRRQFEMKPAFFEIYSIVKTQPQESDREHDLVALQAAREGIVLLKNDGILPLQENAFLNIFGSAFHDFRIGAVGAGRINPRFSIGMRRGIEEYSKFSYNMELGALYSYGSDQVPDGETLKRAREKSNIGIVVIGRASGENFDNVPYEGGFLLTEGERALLQCVSVTFEKTIVILNTGYPIDMTWLQQFQISAVVFCGYLGMWTGRALVEVLDGRVTPSGKLPATWAYSLADYPSDKNFYHHEKGKKLLDGSAKTAIDTYYEEDIYLGYRYFSSFGKKTAFPFGYGLSYTKFRLKNFDMRYDDRLTVRLIVENVGSFAGKEVVQLYIKKPSTEAPAIELVGFAKTKELSLGEEEPVTLVAEKSCFTIWTSDGYRLPQGEYVVFVGTSSESLIRVGTFHVSVAETLKSVPARSHAKPMATFSHGFHPEIIGGKSGIVSRPAEKPSIVVSEYPIAQHHDALYKTVSSLSVKQLARITVASSGGWGMENIGEAAKLYPSCELHLPKFVVADGNSGVNIKVKNIGMPSGTGICASFNTELAESVGRVIGEEAKKNGID